MTDQDDLKTYRGNCHCGDYVFLVKLYKIRYANRCNCSACHKRGSLWVHAAPGDTTYVKGDWDAISKYTFNTNVFQHKFCPRCGTCLMLERTPKTLDCETLINIRTLQGIDIWGVEIGVSNGKAYPSQYESPTFTGIEPAAELEGGQVYTGSCHCGAVRLAVKSKPLNENYTDMVIDCNCSLDRRYGAVWIYPEDKYISIQGEENLTKYVFGREVAAKSFCRFCGIPVCSKYRELPQEEVVAMPKQAQSRYHFGQEHTSINVRLLEGVHLDSLPVEKADGWNNTQAGYVNP
ncbi:Mss4-like protein [Xylariales sp. PMI_506]|nr:Mss4-like protein [Xylariales sp. PMI_506]